MSAAHEFMKVQAIGFAVRAGHPDEMAHRFLTALCDAGVLGQPQKFGPMLARLMDEERCLGCGEPRDNGQWHGYGAEYGGCV